jgi:hypothetical protein
MKYNIEIESINGTYYLEKFFDTNHLRNIWTHEVFRQGVHISKDGLYIAPSAIEYIRYTEATESRPIPTSPPIHEPQITTEIDVVIQRNLLIMALVASWLYYFLY